MKLLISTPLQIFLYDTDTTKLSLIRTGDGYYYGISSRNGTLVISSTDGTLHFFSDIHRTRQTGSHSIQTHQIEWVDENYILAANTGQNCISVFESNGTLKRHVFLNDIHMDDKDAGRAGNHFNTVHKVDDIVYVVAHNYERPSEVFELCWPELNVVNVRETKASWAHNIWPCEYGLIICDSKNGSLMEALTGEVIWKADEKMMARGLAASESHIFVGASKYSVRRERFWKTGGLYIIDRKTLLTAEKVEFPGSGDVNEVRLVGQMDYCHTDQIIDLNQVEAAKKFSPLVTLGYYLRKSHPKLQKEVFPLTSLVRGEQFVTRWISSALNGRNLD